MSVIVSTYNNPAWLEKLLWGFKNQKFESVPYNIIIADDGSREETAELIRTFQKNLDVELRHVWQPDDGFRKCRILNKSILAASEADYLVFTDQDCIPRSDFLASHYHHAEPGHYLSGGYIKLPMNISRELTSDDILSGQVFDGAWLKRNYGFPPLKTLPRLVRNPVLSACFNWMTTTGATCNGNCFSAWKDDLYAVNGFNESLGYGGLDRELGERLGNYGIRAKQLRYSLVCLHLAHDRPYATSDGWKNNDSVRRRVRQSGEYMAPLGLQQIEQDADPTDEISVKIPDPSLQRKAS